MSEKSRPKYGLSKKLGDGEFLNVAMWPGKSNPEDEVISVQLRGFDGTWEPLGRLALYKSKAGIHSELPERAEAQGRGSKEVRGQGGPA